MANQGKLFDWEVRFNVTKTPTLEFTETPAEGEEAATPTPAG